MQHSPVTIEDGFSNPIHGVSPADRGNTQPSIGDKEPNGKIQSTSDIGGIPVIDPLIYSDPGNDGFKHDGNSTGSEPRKRRGRPPGSTNKPRNDPPKAASDLVANLERLLLSIHIMGAAFLNWDELEIDADEARRLSDAIKEVGKHYAMQVDPKKLALIELGVVCAGIYGPRCVTAWRSHKKETIESSKVTPVPKRDDSKSSAIRVENTTVDLATAQAWASQGVE